MKNLSSNDWLRNFNPYIKITRAYVLVIFLVICFDLSSQHGCLKYDLYTDAQEQVTTLQFDTLLTELAQGEYWEEWYHVLLLNCRSLGRNSYREVVDYLLEKGGSMNITDPFVAGQYYYLLAYAYKRAGDLYHALENLKIAYGIFVKIKDPTYTVRCLKGLSHFYSLFNDHYRAIDYGNLYLNQLPISDSQNRQIGHSNLAEYHYHVEQLDQTLRHLDSALYYNPEFLPNKLLTKIKVEFARGNYEDALHLIHHCRQAYQHLDDVQLELKKHEAQYYSRVKKYEQAIEIRQELLNRPAEEGRQREFNKTYQLIAEDYYHSGQYEKALEYAHKLQKYFALDYDTEDYYTTPDSIQLIPEAWLMESLFLKASIFRQLWIGQIDKDEIILETYEKAMYVLDRLRQQYSAIGSVFNISEVDYVIFDEAISFCHQRFEATQERRFHDKAFLYSQIAKSFALKQSKSYRSILQSSFVDEQHIRQYLHFATTEAASLEEKNRLIDSLQYYQERISTQYPNFHNSNQTKSLSIRDVQTHIPSSSALLHFFIGKKHIHCFTICADSSNWIIKNIPTGIDSLMSTYERTLKNIDYILENPEKAEVEYLHTAGILYKSLISEQIKVLEEYQINHLLVVSDDFINQVSFEAMPIIKNQPWTDIDIYLINKYKISYLYLTAEILHPSFNVVTNIKTGVSYGNDYTNYTNTTSELFSTLDHTIDEASTVAAITNSKLKTNKEVQIKHIKQAIQEMDLMHYSGHAFYDANDYTKSYLPVYDGNDAGRISYNVLLSQISSLKFASLSACNTTNGQDIRTEGLIGLSRAMIEGQTASCLGSLWNASDVVSQDILVNFYNELTQGLSKPAALRKAQLTHLQSPQIRQIHRIPLFWANWKLYGHTAPLHFHNNSWIYFLLAGLVLVLLFFFSKKIKKVI